LGELEQAIDDLTADTATSETAQEPEAHKLTRVRIDPTYPTGADYRISFKRSKQQSMGAAMFFFEPRQVRKVSARLVANQQLIGIRIAPSSSNVM